MKIYRSGRTSRRWSVTDTKPLADWASSWAPGKVLSLDATIDKLGSKRSDVGVEFEPDDVLALVSGLVRHLSAENEQLKQRCESRKQELTERDEEMARLRRVFEKVSAIVDQQDTAPSATEVLNEIGKIADYYSESWHLGEYQVEASWLDWNNL